MNGVILLLCSKVNEKQNKEEEERREREREASSRRERDTRIVKYKRSKKRRRKSGKRAYDQSHIRDALESIQQPSPEHHLPKGIVRRRGERGRRRCMWFVDADTGLWISLCLYLQSALSEFGLTLEEITKANIAGSRRVCHGSQYYVFPRPLIEQLYRQKLSANVPFQIEQKKKTLKEIQSRVKTLEAQLQSARKEEEAMKQSIIELGGSLEEPAVQQTKKRARKPTAKAVVETAQVKPVIKEDDEDEDEGGGEAAGEEERENNEEDEDLESGDNENTKKLKKSDSTGVASTTTTTTTTTTSPSQSLSSSQ